MKSKHHATRRPRPGGWHLCDSPRPGDGVSPAELKRSQGRKSGGASHGRHRTLQLCKAVERSLAGALTCDCGDPLLRELSLLSVRPSSQGAAVLEVTLAATGDEATLLSRLNGAAGLLRSVLACEIQRKRLPSLRFRLVPRASE